jgi:hypothetical protein
MSMDPMDELPAGRWDHSRILVKLGVAGRGEAAAAAHRLGLDR